MDINQITVPEFFTGGGSVDAAPIPLVDAGYQPMKLYKGVRVRAGSGNTDTIYVGPKSVSTRDGFPLAAGEEIDVPVDDVHKVYVIGAPSANSSQTVTLANIDAAAKFVLAYNGVETDPLASNAAAATVQAALEDLFGADNVSAAGSAGGPYTVTFVGDLAGMDVELMTGDVANEAQTVEVTDGAAGDVLVLTYDGTDADPVAYDADAATVQTALEAAVGAGNVSVTGGPGSWATEFIGELAGTDVSDLTGVCGQNEVQTVAIDDTTTGGTFTLQYGADAAVTIDFDADAAAIETAMEGSASIGAGQVSVTGGPGPAIPWIIEFTGTLARTDVTALVGDGTLLTGGSTTDVTVTETAKGHAATVTISEVIKGDADATVTIAGL